MIPNELAFDRVGFYTLQKIHIIFDNNIKKTNDESP